MYSQKLMNKCIQHAKCNPIQSRGRTSISRMAAIITDGWIEYNGWNKYKSHPLMKKFSKDDNKICLHAEIDALKEILWSCGFNKEDDVDILLGCDIYIARVLKNDQPALAKPCPTCLGALEYFGIRNIYHT